MENRLKKLPHIPDKRLYRAVCYVVLCIEKTGISLSGAIQEAKKTYPVKAEILRYVRMCYSKDFFIKRSRKAWMNRLTKEERDKVYAQQKNAKYDRQLQKEFMRHIE